MIITDTAGKSEDYYYPNNEQIGIAELTSGLYITKTRLGNEVSRMRFVKQ